MLYLPMLAKTARLSFRAKNVSCLSTVAWTQSSSDGSKSRQTYALAGLLGVGILGTAYGQAAVADEPKVQVVPPEGDSYKRPDQLKGIPTNMVLYQYEVCPYCCKVKAVLDYYKIPYNIVEVNPLTKGELKWSSYKKVPVIKADGEVLVDSTAIISRLAAELEALRQTGPAATSQPPAAAAPSPAAPAKSKSWFWGASSSSSKDTASQSDQQPSAAAVVAAGGSQSAAAAEEEEQWRRWVDDKLVKLVTANIYRTFDESKKSFSYITDQSNWSWGTREMARWTGAVLMWRIGAGMPKKYNIEGDLRQALYTACNEFVEAVGSRRYMGGDKPNLADLAVFGVLRAVENTPTVQDALNNSRIGPWYILMKSEVGPSSRIIAPAAAPAAPAAAV